MLCILHSFDFLKQIEAYNCITLFLFVPGWPRWPPNSIGFTFFDKKCCHSRFQNSNLMHFGNLSCNIFFLLMVIYWDWYLAFIDVLLFKALSFYHSTFGDKILLAFKTHMSSLLKTIYSIFWRLNYPSKHPKSFWLIGSNQNGCFHWKGVKWGIHTILLPVFGSL